jgi:UDP-GlcNAc:undecaprenyl-phosphate GlcNAc-1-phosphate transferase
MPIVIGLQLAALVGSRVYRSLWRYLGIADVALIVRGHLIGTALGALAVVLLFRFEGYSRAVFALDWVIGSALLVAARAYWLALRHWFSLRPRLGERRVLVVGANDSGAVALRLLSRATTVHHRAVGMLDDDPGKRYRRVGGIPIVGTTREIAQVIQRLQVDLVILALDEPGDAAQLVRAACEDLGVECREFLVKV